MPISAKNKKPVISVVVPAYNEEKLLPQCLKALKNQRFSLPYEIVVVDNNSTDKTAEIARKAKVRVIFEKNRSISAARQKGIEVSQALIIAQTDADAIPCENWLLEIYSSFSQRNDIAAVAGPSPFYDIDWLTELILKVYDIIVFRVMLWFLGNGVFRGFNVAFKKSAWKKAGGYFPETAWFDDVEFGKRLRQTGKIIFNPKQVVFSSPRRLKNKGWLRTFLLLLQNSFKINVLGKRDIPLENFR